MSISSLISPRFRPFTSLVLLLTAVVFAPAARALTATPSTTEGPYYTLSSANTLDKTVFTGEAGDNNLLYITSSSTQASGTVQLLSGTLVNTSGVAIAGAVIELWEADNNGIYYYVSSSSSTNNYANRDRNFQHFGVCTTDSSGAWSFLTVRPGLYVGRIRHFHLKIKIGGTLYLTTQLMPQDEVTATPSDNIVSSLGSNVSLCTYTPTTGTITWGSRTYTGLIASKQLVVAYTVTTVAPTITTEPSAVTVTAGASATFSVVASGTAPLTYQWYKNGSHIEGATGTSYTIGTTTTSDAGDYQVVVTNSAGSDTSVVAKLTVNAAVVSPTITTQPQSVSVLVGESASLATVAAGTDPLTYQWYKGQSAVSGATASTYSIASATSAHAGSYYIIVSNSGGSITSNTVTLTVTEPFAAYVAGYGLTSTTGAPDADPDGDGIPNLLEFILGGNPTDADTSIQPSLTYTTVNGSAAIVFSFYSVTSLGSVGWSVETSPDLSTWTTAIAGTNGVTVTSTSAGTGVNLVTVTVPTTAERMMARLRITVP